MEENWLKSGTDYQPMADEIASLSYSATPHEIAALSYKSAPAWGLEDL
jgi:hypothetical protein